MTRKLTTICTLLLALCACAKQDPALQRLDETLAMKETYEEYFRLRISVLQDLLTPKSTPEQQYDINKKIADEFSSYSMDSTVLYLEKNRDIANRLGDIYKKTETDFMLARIYGRAGLYSDATEILGGYSLEQVPPDLEYAYYEISNYIYGELAAYSSNNSQYWQKRDMHRVSMLRMLEEGTYEWYDQKRTEAEAEQNTDLALEYAVKAMDESKPNTRQYARAAFFVAQYQPDEQQKLHYLALSAIADVMCATKDYASLNTISELLYHRGDVDKAFKYAADHCMPDALIFGGRLRPWQIAQFLPALEQAYAAKNARSARKMTALVAVAFLLLIALGGLMYFLSRRQAVLVRTRKDLEASKASIERRNRELEDVNGLLQEVNGKLHESNKVRQTYIGLFLQNLSENISKTREYKNHVLKYIRRGNDKYLVEEIEALPPIDEDIRSFNKMFDETFINLYPDFVEKFNGLLQDGEAIIPKGEDILTPELRVFALIKLGISDSTKIASLLHFSANTIYNYRAKIKNKAKGDRDLFEDAVRSIE